MPYEHNIWQEEPFTGALFIAGFKDHAKGQSGSATGQIAYECPMATKFGTNNPWSECNALLGAKVMQG